MARSSWSQTNFLGGEWSPSAQGRLDLPEYRTALAQCRNMLPQEEGSLVRRSGTRMCGPTSNGQFAVTFSWDITGQAFYDLEISVSVGTGSSLRIWQGDQPVLDSTDTVASISTANPAVIQTNHAQTWNTGDFVMLQIGTGLLTGTTGWAPILNRQLQITKIDTTHFSVPINGALLPGGGLPTTNIGHIVSLGLPYTTLQQVFNICPIIATFSGQSQMYLLCTGVAPQVVTMTVPPTPTTWPTFTAVTPFFQGPYIPFSFAQTGSVSAASGVVTLTATGVLPNGGVGFLSTDVNRSIRLLSQPAPYNNSTSYAQGASALFNNTPYISLVSSNLGNQPDLNPTKWAVELNLIIWADGKVTAFTSSTVVTVDLQGANFPTPNGLTIATFTLGLYTSSVNNAFPTCGTFHEGRLWLAGAAANRIDGSEVNPTSLSFRPTDVNGNVLSTSAISYPILSPSNNSILWMTPDQGGIIVGTQVEEWLITSTNNNNILTPTTMQAHRQTKYGSFLSQPIHAGLSYIFIQRYGNIIYEYLIDVFAQRFGALPINTRAKTVSNFISQLTYAANITPVIWGRTFSGGLSGCTYRRTSRFLNTPPDFNGWHQHTLSGIAPFISSVSTSAYPSPGGTNIDAVPIVTGTGLLSGSFYRQILMPSYDPLLSGFDDEYAWHLDGAVTGIYQNSPYQPNIFVGLSAIEDGTNMYFLGLWYQPSTVSVYIAGIYFGDISVVNGAVTVPYGSDPAGLGTRAYLATQLVASGTNGGCLVQGLGTLPVIIGSKFISTIKLLRQDVSDEARTPNGMAVGETRRPYMASANIAVAYNNSVTVGVDNQLAYPMVFRQYINGPPLANNTPFSGIWQDTVNADESYDGQLIINITGPQPFILTNILPFVETEER